jgi:hypothetical protein
MRKICIAGALALISSCASAAPVALNATYVINLAGVNIATITARFADDGQNYDLDLSAAVTGIGELVAEGVAEVDSSGDSSSGELKSNNFDLMTMANGERFTVDVRYANGNATAFVVDPPLMDQAPRVPVERSHLTQVNDAIAPFIVRSASLETVCDRSLQVFTGIERFNMRMQFAALQEATSPRTGYQGPVALCSLRYTPVSGHFESSEITRYLADSDRIHLWFAPVAQTGYFIPYRVLMGTNVGDLSMVLTALN